MTDIVAEFPNVSDVMPGAFYNDGELQFISDHLGETPYRALRDFRAADNGVVRETITYGDRGRQVPHVNDGVESFTRTVTPILQRIHDLVDTEDPGFVGVSFLKKGIDFARKYGEEYVREKSKDPEGKGWHPSMYAKDQNGNRYYQGRTSDSGYISLLNIPLVKSAVVARKDFTVDIRKELEASKGLESREDVLSEDRARDFTESLETLQGPTELVEGKNYYECPIDDCGYRATYKADSPRSRNGARQNVLNHMLKTKDEIQPHHEAHSLISRQ